MTTEISGKVEDTGGNAIQGARVFIVRESDDTVAATDTTDSLGEYQVVGLSEFETYFVTAQYDDGSTKYAGTSYPAVTPFTGTGPIDDMEDADIVEYQGEKLSFDIINSPVFEGTNALGMTNDDNGSHIITSQSGLPRYPEEGDTFSFRTYLEPDAQESGFLFGVKDSNNYYRAKIIDTLRSSEISIGKVSGGSRSTFETEFASIPSGEWVEGVIDWQSGGDRRFTLYDAAGNQLAQTPLANDTEFSSETGIGWLGNVESFSGDAVYYDLAQITSLSGSPGVTTLSPTNIGPTEATLEGSLDSLGATSSADVWFDWRETGASSFNSTTKQTLSATGPFDETITNLTRGADYECRAIAENSAGVTEGNLVTFQTTPETLIDDWEDGEAVQTPASNWSNWKDVGQGTGMGVTSSGAISGTYSGELFDPGGSETFGDKVEVTRDNPTSSLSYLEFDCYITFPSGSFQNSSDSEEWRLRDSPGGTALAEIGFKTTREINTANGDVGTWTAGTIYNVRFDNFDFSAETYDVSVTGSDANVNESCSFRNSVSGFQEIYIVCDGSNERQDIKITTDNYKIGF